MPAARADRDQGDAADFAHTQLREAILTGKLSPGAPISQVQLAGVLGLSRTPLREAIRMLQREGLVEAQANRPVRVAPITVEDAEGLYVARVTLEAVAVRISLPHMDTQQLAAAEGRLAEMAHFVEAGEYEYWESTHQAFHSGLTAHCGKRITTMLDQLSAHAERYRRIVASQAPRAWSTGQDEHNQILEACAAGDTDRAAARLADHLGRTGFTVISLLDPAYVPQALETAVARHTNNELVWSAPRN